MLLRIADKTYYIAALKTLCYLKVLQNKLDGVSWLAALVQLMVHLVKLSF